MPAVVRVKRRIDEEPLSAFVLNGKKRRLNNECATPTEVVEGDDVPGLGATNRDEVSTILKFAGTVKEQDNTAIRKFASLTKDEAKELVQRKSRKPTNLTERARQEMRQSLHENRFRVVNCLRTTLEANVEDEETGQEVTIVDIEKQSATTVSTEGADGAAAAAPAFPDSQHSVDSDSGYVYDLYLPENEQQADNVDLMDDNYLSVEVYDKLYFENRFHGDDVDDNEFDSEDSNDENYFGNDYPDEEDEEYGHSDESEDAKEMRLAVERFGLGNDGSSDDDDLTTFRDPYVYAVNADEEAFVDDVDLIDAQRYGVAYARYKKRILKSMRNDTDNSETESDSHE